MPFLTLRLGIEQVGRDGGAARWLARCASA
jgi:hypothetical protein